MFVKSQVDLLLNGVEGSIIINNIRSHFKTHFSFEKNVSNVRREYLKLGFRNVEYAKFVQIIENKIKLEGCEESLILFSKFKSLNLIDQYDCLHKSKKNGFFAPKYEELNNIMRTFKLLPDNMISFKMNNEDSLNSGKHKKIALLQRNRFSINIVNAEHLLQIQIDILQNGSKNKVDEILALLLVSGRRETEILNGKSVFEQIPNMPYHVNFTGVLKKKTNPLLDTAQIKITIPLLCNSSVFILAFNRMRLSQNNDIADMNNKQISARYCSQLNAAGKKKFPMINKIHDLRGVYIKYIDKIFSHQCAFPFLCMLCLGHDAIEDSLHYQKINISNMEIHEQIDLNIESFLQYS